MDKTMKFFQMLMAVILLIEMLFAAQSLHAVTIPAGYDFFITGAGTHVEIGTEPGGDNPPIPLGFFGVKNGSPSDTFSGVVDLKSFFGPNLIYPYPSPFPPFQNIFRTKWLDPHGNEVGPNSAHKVQQVLEPIDPFDTIIQRKDSATLANAGDSTEVEIEIIWLSLVSIDPIKVTYGPEPSSFFDVYVGLSDSTPQQQGKTRLTATVPGGSEGTVDLGSKTDPVLGLPLIYDVYFFDVNDSSTKYKISNVPARLYNSELGAYTAVPEPSTWLHFGIGLAGIWLCGRRKQKGIIPGR